MPDYKKRLADYNRKRIDEERNLIIYQDPQHNPDAVLIPFSRYSELLGIEAIVADLAKE